MGREGQPRALRHSALPAGSCRPEPSSPGPPFGSCILLDSGNPSPPVLTNFCALSAGAQLPAPPVRASASWAPKPGGCAAEAVWVLSEHRKPGPAWLPCSSPGAACVIRTQCALLRERCLAGGAEVSVPRALALETQLECSTLPPVVFCRSDDLCPHFTVAASI